MNQNETKTKPRSTPVRRELLAAFEDASGPLAVAELRERLDAAGIQANKTTVYRQLDSLVQQGLVVELDLGEGLRRYERREEDLDHPHLLCTHCGRIECLPVDRELIEHERIMAQNRGFHIEACSLEFRGICSSCHVKRKS